MRPAPILVVAAGAAAAWALSQRRSSAYYDRTPPPMRRFHEDERRAATPIWREALAAVEWARLRLSPVQGDDDAPRGDGSAVVIVPGFLFTDRYLYPLSDWLACVGYRPYLSGIGRNADCLDVLATRLLRTVDEAFTATGRRVHVIGHSLGGTLARGVAARHPERIASVATLGTPLRGLR
ncbi:MAG: esterase/lipase family protein, partial [Candidatus Rokuibacteriota bacterium]